MPDPINIVYLVILSTEHGYTAWTTLEERRPGSRQEPAFVPRPYNEISRVITIPIESHEDLFALAKEEINIGKIFKKIAADEKAISDTRDKLAKDIDALIMTKSQAITALKEIAKKIGDLDRSKGGISGVDKSRVDPADIEMYNKWAKVFEADKAKLSELSNALKTLSYQVTTLVEKLRAFGEGFENMGAARKKLTRADKILFENKDKLMKPEKIGAMENAKEAAERDFDMAKKDITRRKDEYLKELQIFNEKLNDVAEKMKV